MTANQIAARSVAEEIRHNQAVEEETGRHNSAMEELEWRAQNITDDYQKEKNKLQKEYNDLYIEYLNAAEQDKVDLESRLNDIKEYQTHVDEQYKINLANLEAEKNAITASYNDRMLEKYGIDQQIENRKVEYEKQIADDKIALSYEQLNLAKLEYEQKVWKEQQDIFLKAKDLSNTEWGLNLRSKELDLSSKQFEFDIQKWEDQSMIREAQTKLLNSERLFNTSRTIDLWNPFKLSNEASQLMRTGIQLLF